MKRSELLNIVIWPAAAGACVNLFINDPDPQQVGTFEVTSPLRGVDFSKMVPDVCEVEFEGCFLCSTCGPVQYTTAVDYDSDVVPHRKELSSEERLERLERRDFNLQKLLAAERLTAIELNAKIAALDAAAAADEADAAVIDDEPQEEVPADA